MGAPSTPNGPTPGNVASPSASQRSGPHTPGVTSPPAQSVGMGHPQARPPSFQPGATFSPASNAMSPAARQFEPAGARKSSAIKIINPNTQATVDIKPSTKEGAGTPTKTPAAPAATAAAAPNQAPSTPVAVSKTPATPTVATAAPPPATGATGTPSGPVSSGPPSASASSSPAPIKASIPASGSSSKMETAEDFMKKVRARAEESRRLKEQKAAAEARQAQGTPDKAAEEEVQKKKAEEEEARKEEAAQKEAAALKEAAQKEEAAKAEAKTKAAPPPIDTSVEDNSEQVIDPTKAATTTPNFRSSAAEVERMAREASSVPSTPLDGSAPRLPQTPRTPGTPGFANLPAKPMSSMHSSASNGIKLDAEALERRKKTTAPAEAAQGEQTSEQAQSAASVALDSARFIEDITKVSYPDKILSPRSDLNESAEPGKFRYDRDFLLQFMGIYKERPTDLPPLATIGMDSSQASGSRSSMYRKTSGMGPPAAPGRSGSVGLGLGGGFGKGGMGQFSHPGKDGNARGNVGAFGNSGPMGSFNAGARSQPLSRTGSGSNTIPTRESMGTGVPAGGRTGSRRGKDRRDPGRSGVNPPEKGGPTIPMDQVVPLSNSDNRWVGGRGGNVKADSPDMVNRKVKALLNKLTLEKFDSISTQILEWANKSVDETDGQTLRIVIALVFEKATDEAAWSELYATLCRKIMEKLDPNIQDENIKTNDDKPVMGGHLFRKYLVNRCQEDFERGWAQRESTAAAAKSKEAEDNAKKAINEKNSADAKDAEARGEKSQEKDTEMLSDEYYEAQKAKRRGLGLVRFIGELFKFQMLTEKIMHLCIQRLLSNAQTPEEEEVESLCKLMTTIGKLLDEGRSRSYVDVYFQRMGEMMNHGAISQRMKFMLQDIIELRSHGWKPRHDTAPKTIAQIHEDAAKAKVQAEAERQRSFMGGSMSRGGSRRGQVREQYGADGFITVGNQQQPAPAPKAGNLSGFGKGIDRSGSNRPLSAGPQSVFARKNQKSDDGSNPPSRTASSQNIFSLLSANPEGAEQAQATEESSGRPKLNLSKRTKPLPGQEGDQDVEGEMSDEAAKQRIDNDIKEFLEIRDVEEGKLAMESLPTKRRAEFIDKITETVLNRKEEDVRLVGQLFSKARQSTLLTDEMAQLGFKAHMEFLDDISIDVPSAYTFMAILLVASDLPTDKIEALADTIQGEGLKPPKERLLAKVDDERS